jgi:hypothetical protein
VISPEPSVLETTNIFSPAKTSVSLFSTRVWSSTRHTTCGQLISFLVSLGDFAGGPFSFACSATTAAGGVTLVIFAAFEHTDTCPFSAAPEYALKTFAIPHLAGTLIARTALGDSGGIE